jgi:hypothetical protein
MGVMEHFLLLVPGPLPGCIFMRHIILALFTVCLPHLQNIVILLLIAGCCLQSVPDSTPLLCPLLGTSFQQPCGKVPDQAFRLIRII